MRKIVFMNNKGGVGKTASSINVAHLLSSKFGKRVLLTDLDPQMNATTMFDQSTFLETFYRVRDNKVGRDSNTIEDVILDKDYDIHNAICKTKYTNLFLLPSRLSLSLAEERLKADFSSPQQIRLKKQLNKIEDEYDYCILDASPSISALNINGLAAADFVFIPVRCDGNSLVGASITMRLIHDVMSYNEKLKVGGIFFTQFCPRKKISSLVTECMEKAYGDLMMKVSIRQSKNVEECSVMQMPLFKYDEHAAITNDYISLTQEIISITERTVCETKEAV